MKDKKKNKRKAGCKKSGEWTQGGAGYQPELILYRCKDRVNCDVCGYIYVEVSGRLATVENAINDGAKVYCVPNSEWNKVRRYETKRGLDTYIKISKDGTSYIVAKDLSHDAATEIDPEIIDFSTLIRYSQGSNQFKGEYAINRTEKKVLDFEFSTYFPLFADRWTENVISPDVLAPSYLAGMYKNPLMGLITSENIQEYMIWRAEVLASTIALDNPNWKAIGFYKETHKTNKAEIDTGEAVTYRDTANSKLHGPGISDATAALIDAIQHGEKPPLFKIDIERETNVVTGSWEYLDGLLVLETEVAQVKAYQEAEFKWFCDYIEGRADSTTYPKIEDFIIL